jgi:hypothetical protein
MCEGVFLFLQLFKLTTSNWFGHTVRAQRVHEVRGTSAWTDRSGAETHEVQWTSALSRPKRSGDPRGPGDLGLDRPERRPQVQLLLVQSLAERHTFSPIPITTNTVEIFITC